MLKRSKKGFTLAELLIVVAIIAVLVAIAVPLFVSSLDKANDATKDANKRSVRVAATYEILTADKPAVATTPGEIYTNENGTLVLKGPWYVLGILDNSGNLEKVIVSTNDKNAQDADSKKAYSATNDYVEDGGKIYVSLKIEKSALTPGTAPSTGSP